MLKEKTDKLEFEIKSCPFVGYSKEKRRSLFYTTQNKKLSVSTNVVFHGEDYMKNFKLRSKTILDEL